MKNQLTKWALLPFLFFLCHHAFSQPLSINISDMTVKCSGSPTGILSASAFGGMPAYNYAWYDGTWTDLSNPSNMYTPSGYGTYHCVVTDFNTDKDTATVVISQQYPPTVTLIPVELHGTAHTGCGEDDGTLNIDMEGGITPYQVKVYSGPVVVPSEEVLVTVTSDTLVTVSDLVAGVYTVIVGNSSGLGCSVNKKDTLLEPTPLTIDLEGDLYDNEYYVSCDTCHDGSFSMTVNNGNGTVTKLWLEAGEAFEPGTWLKGATKSSRVVLPDGEEPSGIDPEWIVGTGEDMDSLSPETWYQAVAFDEAGCFAIQSLNIEKPKPVFAWGWNGNSGADKWLGTNDSTDLRLWTDSVERMVIKADGNIGIGTGNPSAKLHVSGPTLLDGDLYLPSLATGSGNGFGLALIDSVGQITLSDSLFEFPSCFKPVLAWSRPYGDSTNSNITTCWESVDKVGIGFLNPSHKLHVDGDVRVNATMGVGIDADNDIAVKTFVDNPSKSAAEFIHEDENGKAAVFTSGGNKLYTIPRLGDDAFNWLADEGDIGLIWSDGNGTSGKNDTAGLVIGPHGDASNGIRIDANGNVAIGTTDPKGYKLAVRGEMVTEEAWVKLHADWPDFVFAENHQMLTLPELDEYVKENRHLPNVPKADEVKEKGIPIGEMNTLLLQKIEELTLYLIEQDKQMQKLKAELQALKKAEGQ